MVVNSNGVKLGDINNQKLNVVAKATNRKMR